jgi:hypothetical protein
MPSIEVLLMHQVWDGRKQNAVNDQTMDIIWTVTGVERIRRMFESKACEA